jgi:ABC-type multidrug transport system ATPase subunit
VIIINRGTVAASGSLAELSRSAGEQDVLVVVVEGAVDRALLAKRLNVGRFEAEPVQGGTRFLIPLAGNERLAPRLSALAAEQGWTLRELRPQQQTLEDLFVRIVGRQEDLENVA